MYLFRFVPVPGSDITKAKQYFHRIHRRLLAWADVSGDIAQQSFKLGDARFNVLKLFNTVKVIIETIGLRYQAYIIQPTGSGNSIGVSGNAYSVGTQSTPEPWRITPEPFSEGAWNSNFLGYNQHVIPSGSGGVTSINQVLYPSVPNLVIRGVLTQYNGTGKRESTTGFAHRTYNNYIDIESQRAGWPVFAGYVNEEQDDESLIKRRRWLMLNTALLSDLNNLFPAGSFRQDNSTTENIYMIMRLLSWVDRGYEGVTEEGIPIPLGQWNTILLPAPPIPFTELRFGNPIYLGHNKIVVWCFYHKSDEPSKSLRSAAWYSLDYGVSWVPISNGNIIATDAFDNEDAGGSGFFQGVDTTRVFAYSLGQNHVGWHAYRYLRDEGGEPINLPIPLLEGTRCYYWKDFQPIQIGGWPVQCTKNELNQDVGEIEPFLESYIWPILNFAEGSAMVMIKDLSVDPPKFKYKITEDYGITWTITGEFPISQYDGLPADREGFSWPYEYKPALGQVFGLDTENNPIDPEIIVAANEYVTPEEGESFSRTRLYSSRDLGLTWISRGIIRNEELRWVAQDVEFGGWVTPQLIFNIEPGGFSNRIQPFLDEPVEDV